ncbi:MAG: tetratricopeptide repeat protein [Phycisphaerales bacterium JB039]
MACERKDRRLLLPLAVIAALALAGCQGGGNERKAAEATMRAQALDAEANGRALLSQDRLADAAREFERAIAINPLLTGAHLGLGEVRMRRGEHADAERAFATAAEQRPDSFEAQFNHGLALQLLDRVTDAIGAYLRALSLRPSDFGANLNLATAYLQADEPRQAVIYAERAVRIDGRSAAARTNLGAVYAALGRHEQAVIEYQQAAELMDPITPELLINLAESLRQAGRYEEMRAALTELITREPSAAAWERLGFANFKLRRYDDALAAFRAAIRADESYYPAWNGVGVCMLNRYEFSQRADSDALREAVKAMQRSLQINRSQPQIVQWLSKYG